MHLVLAAERWFGMHRPAWQLLEARALAIYALYVLLQQSSNGTLAGGNANASPGRMMAGIATLPQVSGGAMEVVPGRESISGKDRPYHTRPRSVQHHGSSVHCVPEPLVIPAGRHRHSCPPSISPYPPPTSVRAYVHAQRPQTQLTTPPRPPACTLSPAVSPTHLLFPSPRATPSWQRTAMRFGTVSPLPTAAGPQCTALGGRRGPGREARAAQAVHMRWGLGRQQGMVVVVVTAQWLCCFNGWRPWRGSCR